MRLNTKVQARWRLQAHPLAELLIGRSRRDLRLLKEQDSFAVALPACPQRHVRIEIE